MERIDWLWESDQTSVITGEAGAPLNWVKPIADFCSPRGW